MDFEKLTGAVRLAGAAAAIYVAATGKTPGLARAGLGIAALALAVRAYGNFIATGEGA